MGIIGFILIAFAIFLALQNRSQLNELNRRLAALEAGTPRPKPAPAAAPAPPPRDPEPERAAAYTAPPPPRVSAPAKPAASLEERLGARWTVWVGGLSLALGAVFLVAYSIEAGLLGPGVRITLGLLFSAVLVGGGEYLRRRKGRLAAGTPTAHIPSILTAAGTVGAFASVYSAYALYGFIGPASAFIALGIIGVGCMLAAALHGPWLAGLGLLGAMITPLLISSEEPSAWALLMYVAAVTIAAFALARIREWTWLAVTACALAVLWGCAYLASTGTPDSGAVLVFVFAMSIATVLYHAMGEYRPVIDLPPTLMIAAFGFLALLLFQARTNDSGVIVAFGVLMALYLAAAWRFARLTGLLAAALALSTAAFVSWDLTAVGEPDPTLVFPPPGDSEPLPGRFSLFLTTLAVYGALFLAAGTARAFTSLERVAKVPLSWAGLAVMGPLFFLLIAYCRTTDMLPDIQYAAVAGGLAALYVFLTDRFVRLEADHDTATGPTGAFAAGASAALALGLAMILREGYLTIALALLAAGLAWTYLQRPIPALRILAYIVSVIVVLLTLANPLVIENPGSTPVFNALLWGYGIPAVAFAAAAWLFRQAKAARESGIFDVLALLYAVLLLFFQIRHWAQGGDMFAPSISLYETGLQATVAFLLAAATHRLNEAWKGPLLTAAAWVVGIGGAIFSAASLIIANPMLTGAAVGDGPFVAPLILGYLFPAIAAALYALLLRRTGSRWQAQLGALCALVLTLAYATLEVRSAFHAPDLVAGETTDFEQYTYSVVWLLLGIALLVPGVLLQSRVIRLGSAAVICLVVLKVFLVDMADLTGILRALSFIGLGLVLVGIGAVYQRLLSPGGRSRRLRPTSP